MTANTQNFRVKNGLDVTGNTTLSANLDVTGDVSISETLSVANTLTTQSIEAGNTVTISNTKLTISGPNIEGSNDAIEVTRGATNLRDVYITGDLSVTGVTTLTTTENFEIGTSEFILASGLASDAAPTTNANLIVNRGSSSNVFIRWDENNDRWMFTDNGSSVYPLKTYSSYVYTFNTSTASGGTDLNQGEIKLSSTNAGSATTFRIKRTDIDGNDLYSLINNFDSINSSTKGYILIRSSEDQSKYISYRVVTVSYSSVSTYFYLGVAAVAVGTGSGTFNASEVLHVEFSLAGDKGEVGATGQKGDTGAGEKGEKGDTGAKGDTGDKGDQIDSATYNSGTDTVTFAYADATTFDLTGIKGDKGQKGEEGEKGEKGEKGQKGEVGDTGAKGDKGGQISTASYDSGTDTVTFTYPDTSTFDLTGIKGDKGQKGEAGSKGQKGEKITSGSYNSGTDEVTFTVSDSSTFNVGGLKGNKGDANDKGDKGDTGATGAKGDKGEAGTDGSKGDTGSTGDKGDKGDTGATGSTGAKGEPGEDAYTDTSPQLVSVGVGTPASTTTGEIRATNNITAYYSDDRLKTRISNLANALEKVKSLNGFYYKANELAQSYGYESNLEVGVSAQEVQAVLPEVVVPAPIDDQFLTVRYEKMIPLLVEAIKELSDIVDKLQQDR